MTHPLTDHEIVRLRHEERVGRAHAAMHSLEAREARSTKSEAGERRAQLLARPAPAARERSAADAGTQRHQLSVTDSGTCRRARRMLSVVADGEASRNRGGGNCTPSHWM